MAAHDIRVAVLVDADEYMDLQSMCVEDGLSNSAFMRRLLKQEARKRDMGKGDYGTQPSLSGQAIYTRSLTDGR